MGYIEEAIEQLERKQTMRLFGTREVSIALELLREELRERGAWVCGCGHCTALRTPAPAAGKE